MHLNVVSQVLTVNFLPRFLSPSVSRSAPCAGPPDAADARVRGIVRRGAVPVLVPVPALARPSPPP